MDARDLQALRQLCITNCHVSILDITTWAQENFQKSLSVNRVHCQIHKCKLDLYHAKKKPDVNTSQKHHPVLWVKAHLKWSEPKQKTVSKFELLFANHGHSVLRTKEERDHPACYQGTVQKNLHL
ncbi:hypothetical protein EXN66_Car016442 [Channa argus]|uniref:Uncharacterized protein n=1 Tax=Channa argus TaxID=215402 RepID=A0A6G1QEA5_CHAAH|nr:hypothetical protein EXN66_Car016442 [Channa argus]